MQNVIQALRYNLNYYYVIIEIDFFIEGTSITWHFNLYFYLSQVDKLVKALHVKKRNMHLRAALNEIYFEVNNDPLLRYGLDTMRIPSKMLDEDHYFNEVYPMIVRTKTSRNNEMGVKELKTFYAKTVYIQ